MTLYAADLSSLGQLPAVQIALAAVLAGLGFSFLLPRPRHRLLSLGVLLCLASAAIFVTFLVGTFGNPTNDLVSQGLFWLFAGGAVSFGTVLVAQRNPARGAIAFAFVILSSCGLFLLLAAPFLMAATVIIYAGAIIVTFLFVLMLSQAGGPSAENDRTREPLLGSLGGFAFTGLILFTLQQSGPIAGALGSSEYPLPASPLSTDHRRELIEASNDLRLASEATDWKAMEEYTATARQRLGVTVGYLPGEVGAFSGQTIQERLALSASDPRIAGIVDQANALRLRKKDIFDRLENNLLGPKKNLDSARADLLSLREDVVRLSGRNELPARNVSAIGHALYSYHLIAVELAGTLLLVATIGAVAIAGRKGATA